jgi:lipopolysaccharide export system protein LptA
MKKQYGILWVFCCLCSLLMGQQTLIYLDHSDKLEFDEERYPDCQILSGNIQFRHDDMLMYCDSAFFFDQKNHILAIGNIKINQADTLFIYGDRLYYDGNTKLAKLRHNVRMENKGATLYTDSLNYNRKHEIGYYFNGGRIVDSENELVSINGHYYPKNDLAIFQYEVVLTNPDFVLTSDTLHYHTQTEVATLLGPSDIVYTDSTFIYSEKGWYDTKQDLAELTTNSHISNLEGNYLEADTLFYNHNIHLAEGFTNVLLRDTAQQVIIKGTYGWYNDSLQTALVTKIPTLINYDKTEKDSLFVTADTFYYANNDSLTYIQAYHHVQAWHMDFQSLCDSAYYSTKDSVLSLYGTPILWNDSNQYTGNTIHIFTQNGDIDRVKLEQNAFIFSVEDSTGINQLSGKEITGYMANNKLYKAHVKGNALSVYFVKEEDQEGITEPEYTGVNRAESSDLILYFTDKNGIKKIIMSPASNGILYTPNKLNDKKVTRLDGFNDHNNIRPKSKTDIYVPKNKETLQAAQTANKVRKRRKALN